MRLRAFMAEDFKAWLTSRGAEVIRPGRGEIVRFLTHEGTGCIYQGTKDKLSFTGLGGSTYQAFMHSDPTWKAYPRPKDKRGEKWLRWTLLSERDGPWCCFCGCPLSWDSHTIEHFLAKTHGGTNYYANLGLACEPCNREVGNIPVAQKLQLAIVRRLANADRTKGPRGALQGPSPSANGTGLHNGGVEQAGRAEPPTVSGRNEGGVGTASSSGAD